MEVYLEVGKKKVFACAIGWEGWSLSGKDEAEALQALLDSAPRYARLLQAAGIPFQVPEGLSNFSVVERLPGDSTTDFGAPAAIPTADWEAVTRGDLGRINALLHAYWAAFDKATQSASGKELRKGPRGGGRDRPGILNHTIEAELAYLGQLGWKVDRKTLADIPLEAKLRTIRQEFLAGLEAKQHRELPDIGPRCGQRWPLRYFVRRSAWHTLDHTWEIEDRLE